LHNWARFNHKGKLASAGEDAYTLIERLYPLCRSITGDGTRETLDIIGQKIALERTELATGTQVFDWKVPKEWNIKDAYIISPQGEKIVDFKQLNLHVTGYSIPVNNTFSKDELLPHLHSLPKYPNWVPYTYSYHNETWGFSISHNQLQALPEGDYQVVVDSELTDGHLSYAEYLIPGLCEQEFLIYAHICHPSLCNDNLSGMAIATELAKYLNKQSPLNFSYRFVFAPTTIGSISWLSQNQDKLNNIKAGLVIAVAGDSGKLTYKKSRQENSFINQLAMSSLQISGKPFDILDFSPFGYDERQFCSPGIDLPIGRLTRTPNGCYPEYHTSADNLDIVKPEYLADTMEAYLDIIELFENNRTFKNTQPFGEPHLGRHGLYKKSGAYNIQNNTLAILWVLNQSDGKNSLLDIVHRSKLTYSEILEASKALYDVNLLELIS
jgi:aminopeptidase-like protein